MSIRRPALLVLLLLPSLAGSAAPKALSVYLRPTVYLTGDSYTLADIASVPAAEPEAAALLRLSLGQTPRRPTLLSSQSIGERIAEAGYPQVAVVGGRVALLPRPSVPAAAGRFYEDLLAYLDASDGVAGGRIEVEVLQVGTIAPAAGYVFTPLGSPTPRVSAGSGKLVAGELLLSFGPGSPAGAAPGGAVRLWAHRYLPVAYTAAALPARSPLDGGQVVYREEDVSLSAQAFLTPTDGLEAFRSAIALPAGARLEPRHLERVLAVRTGDAVQVVFLRPGLRVSVPGRAVGSGAVGERIEVRLSAGGRRFGGLIATGGEVCVEGF